MWMKQLGKVGEIFTKLRETFAFRLFCKCISFSFHLRKPYLEISVVYARKTIRTITSRR